MLADGLVYFVAVLHVLFFVLESFLWQTPFARKRFGMSVQKAADTVVLAQNQGVYNLFLAGGLFYAQVFRGEGVYLNFVGYFLVCVVIAGVVGGLTVNKRIFFVQGVPALLALALAVVSR
ncbi:MAG: DUF1304 domain-containing protein [Proteobacteria bacterium]|nr:MAG: DUF1304 domain-containing protein [Pseudomonadota bacterium]